MAKSYEIQFPTELDAQAFEAKAERWAAAVGLRNPKRARSAFIRFAVNHINIPSDHSDNPTISKGKEIASE